MSCQDCFGQGRGFLKHRWGSNVCQLKRTTAFTNVCISFFYTVAWEMLYKVNQNKLPFCFKPSSGFPLPLESCPNHMPWNTRSPLTDLQSWESTQKAGPCTCWHRCQQSPRTELPFAHASPCAQRVRCLHLGPAVSEWLR